jgi:ribosomal protein S18 acetylase RimI-like enzyme
MVTAPIQEPDDHRRNRQRSVPDPETRFMTRATTPETIARDAVAADAAAVSSIGRVAVPDTYKDLIDDAAVMEAIVEQSYALDALRDCIARCAGTVDAHFLVAERGGRIVGFLHYDSEGLESELHRIYVEPTQKRRGIGSSLLQELHRRLAPGDSYILMVVAANRPAVAFYEHHSFGEEARVDGIAYMHEQMGVEFAPGTPPVPALILRFTKQPHADGPGQKKRGEAEQSRE